PHRPRSGGGHQTGKPHDEVLEEVKATLPQPVSDVVAALLVGAAEAGRLCGRSEPSWWRDHAAGRVPAPAWKAPGRTLWSVEELRDWIAQGCPPRKEWEVIRAGHKGGRKK